MSDLMISGGTVIAMDPDRRVIRSGSVGIDGDRIAWVEWAGEEPSPARRTFDASGHYVLPGIVDTHEHAGYSLTRGLSKGRSEVGTPAEPGWGDNVGSIYFHASDEEFLARGEQTGRAGASQVRRTDVAVDDQFFAACGRPPYALAAASGDEEFGLRHIAAAGPLNDPWPRTYTDTLDGTRPREVTVDLVQALAVTAACVQAFAAVLERTAGRIGFYVGPSAVSSAPIRTIRLRGSG